VLPKGTRIAQCISVKRESWVAETSSFTADDERKLHDSRNALGREPDLYRRKLRA
jgi:hypothetical protein